MKKSLTALLLVLGFGVFLVACDNDTATSEVNTPQAQTPTPTPTPTPEETVNTDPIRVVLYPNESGSEFAQIRDYLSLHITEATGRPVEIITTTHYNIAIQAIAEGTADIAYMGPTGYIIAAGMNDNDVRAIFTSSGPSGTLDDAVYFAFIGVRYEDKHLWYAGNGEFDLSGLEGEVMSFVSPTSTSGFVVPGTFIVNYFGLANLDAVGQPGFFSQVNFPDSHPGSYHSVLTGQSNVGAFMNREQEFEHVGGPLNDTGMIKCVREDLGAPFDALAGQCIVAIHAITVPNAPFVANLSSGNLTEAEVDAIVDIFISDVVTNNPNFFGDPDDTSVMSWFARREGQSHRFVRVDPSMYDDLR